MRESESIFLVWEDVRNKKQKDPIYSLSLNPQICVSHSCAFQFRHFAHWKPSRQIPSLSGLETLTRSPPSLKHWRKMVSLNFLCLERSRSVLNRAHYERLWWTNIPQSKHKHSETQSVTLKFKIQEDHLIIFSTTTRLHNIVDKRCWSERLLKDSAREKHHLTCQVLTENIDYRKWISAKWKGAKKSVFLIWFKSSFAFTISELLAIFGGNT